MSHGPQLAGAPKMISRWAPESGGSGQKRLNRLPIYLILGVLLMVIATVVSGLSSRGLWSAGSKNDDTNRPQSASNFAETLKRGVGDGIIGEPVATPPVSLAAVSPPPVVIAAPRLDRSPDAAGSGPPSYAKAGPAISDQDQWRTRLAREHEEQFLNERHRQAMARLQRAEGARAGPLRVATGNLQAATAAASRDLTGNAIPRGDNAREPDRVATLAEMAGAAGLGARDPNGQASKQSFLDAPRADVGGGADSQAAGSTLTLARGSIIPATLLTGINADLPGRILAQVTQNIYDSASGRHLLIPQGARLLGRYDSNVTYGQSRILVVWTDVVLPGGRSLNIGAMAGIDAAGEGGFKDKVDRHLARTFGTAALVALIGTGMDLALPTEGTSLGTDVSDAARRSFSETFGRLAERTVEKTLDVQPTLRIRPGYRFNILVDHDLVFG